MVAAIAKAGGRPRKGLVKTKGKTGEEPLLSRGFTLTCGALLCLWLKTGVNNGFAQEFGRASVVVAIATEVVGWAAKWVAEKRGANTVNVAKTHEQLWQFAVHAAMTYLNWDSLLYMGRVHRIFDGSPTPLKGFDENLVKIYVWQSAIWFVTAFRHRFIGPRGKDYLMMYAHHVVTLLLIIGSYSFSTEYMRFGAYVFILHDASDIVIDIMRLTHDLGIDMDSGIPGAEIFYVANVFSWAFSRLYLFPLAIQATFVLEHDPAGMTWALQGTCVLLLLMHIWWYYLILRIGFKLIVGKGGTHSAGRDYEGESE